MSVCLILKLNPLNALVWWFRFWVTVSVCKLSLIKRFLWFEINMVKSFFLEGRLTTSLHYLLFWWKLARNFIFPGIRGFKEFNLQKSPKHYWILSRSNLGERIMTFLFYLTSIISGVISLSLNCLFSAFLIFSANAYNILKMFLNSKNNHKTFSNYYFSEIHNSPPCVWSHMPNTDFFFF